MSNMFRLGRILRTCTLAALVGSAMPAHATFHLFLIDEIYSDSSGTLQFIELTTSFGGQQFLSGHSIKVTQGGTTHSFTFNKDLPGDTTNHHFLIATQSFADLGIVTPDYIVSDGFLFQPGGTINYADADVVTYTSLPNDGTHSFDRSGHTLVNSPTNFAGQTGSIPAAAPSIAVSLENPQPASFQSGIGLLSGWACQGPLIGIAIDGGTPLGAPYGSARADTASVCGAGNISTGFGLLFNFNTLSAGSHSAQLFVNGQAQGSPTQFTVTVPAGEFLTGASKEVTVPDFPTAGRTTTLIWQQSQQNFAIKSVGP